MERLTLSEAREALLVAQMFARRPLVDEIDWTQPDREALLVAGLLPGAASQDERDALQAVALALLGYQAHLAYEAGRAAVVEKVRSASEDPTSDTRTANRLLDTAEGA